MVSVTQFWSWGIFSVFKLYYLLYFMDPNVIIIYAADLHCILRHIRIPRYIDTH